MSGELDDRVYRVVVNLQEQYSIWPADREPPAGWRAVGRPGAKQERLGYIERVWTDMLPLGPRGQRERASCHRETSAHAGSSERSDG